MNFPLIPIPPFMPLYAETHFRFFPLMPSLLFRPFPEILFDMPARIAPAKQIPVLLLANDINIYHIEIKRVTIIASQAGRSFEIFDTSSPLHYAVHHPFAAQSLALLFSLDRSLVCSGELFINCKVTASKNGRKFDVLNDNYRGSSKAGFRTFIADEPLPGSDSCLYGDMHVHSQYSQSHVEFGPPVSVIDTMASSCGVAFCAITDHSYDIACSMENYLEPDPEVRRWRNFTAPFSGTSQYTTCILPGEEISVLNSKGKVVHLCGVNLREFIPGSSDGARKSLHRCSDLSIAEALSAIERQGGMAFAAHPGAVPPFLHGLLLKRGKWSMNDLVDGLHGFQAANSGFTTSWYRARALWIKALLAGRRLALLAGNDAHGDFNRYRSTGFPFLFIREAPNRHFCYSKTGIYTTDISAGSVTGSLRNGSTFVTSGPFLALGSNSGTPGDIIGTEGCNNIPNEIHVSAESTAEFGYPRILRIFTGVVGGKQESMPVCERITANSYSFSKKLETDSLKSGMYIRAELVCETDDKTLHYSATSPCYLNR